MSAPAIEPAAPTVALTARELALLGAVDDGYIVRWFWPARVVEGDPMPDVSVDLDVRNLRSVRLRIEAAERAGWVELDEERYSATDRVAGGAYEASRWRLTDAGRAARQANGGGRR